MKLNNTTKPVEATYALELNEAEARDLHHIIDIARESEPDAKLRDAINRLCLAFSGLGLF